MKDKKPVCYFYGNTDQMGISMKFNKSEYKDNVVTITAKDNDKFKVEKGDKPFVTHLTHIEK
jgi:hypothetical protein